MRANRKRAWNLKTITVGHNCWLSREDIGRNLHEYKTNKDSPWAGRVTGMILEGYDWELSEIMQSRTKLLDRWENAVEVFKDSE